MSRRQHIVAEGPLFSEGATEHCTDPLDGYGNDVNRYLLPLPPCIAMSLRLLAKVRVTSLGFMPS